MQREGYFLINNTRFNSAPMKTFATFMSEAYDASVMGSSQIRRTGEGGRIGAERKKSTPERRRVKAVGGGKTEPVQYKDRKDIGTQRPRSAREQQPEKERGSAALSAKEAQRKAYKERKAREAGAKTKTASELLTKKKAASKPAPGYKPQKASGLSAAERKAVTKKGERTLRDIQLKNLGKKSEKELKHPITQKEITRRGKEAKK